MNGNCANMRKRGSNNWKNSCAAKEKAVKTGPRHYRPYTVARERIMPPAQPETPLAAAISPTTATRQIFSSGESCFRYPG